MKHLVVYRPTVSINWRECCCPDIYAQMSGNLVYSFCGPPPEMHTKKNASFLIFATTLPAQKNASSKLFPIHNHM